MKKSKFVTIAPTAYPVYAPEALFSIPQGIVFDSTMPFFIRR